MKEVITMADEVQKGPGALRVKTRLAFGYHDPGKVMLYAAFACLEYYVSEIGGRTGISQYLKAAKADPHMSPGDVKFLQEAVSLFHWWARDTVGQDRARIHVDQVQRQN